MDIIKNIIIIVIVLLLINEMFFSEHKSNNKSIPKNFDPAKVNPASL